MARGPKDRTEMLISPGQPLLSDRMPPALLAALGAIEKM